MSASPSLYPLIRSTYTTQTLARPPLPSTSTPLRINGYLLTEAHVEEAPPSSREDAGAVGLHRTPPRAHDPVLPSPAVTTESSYGGRRQSAHIMRTKRRRRRPGLRAIHGHHRLPLSGTGQRRPDLGLQGPGSERPPFIT
jgi:hypothetical protein